MVKKTGSKKAAEQGPEAEGEQGQADGKILERVPEDNPQLTNWFQYQQPDDEQVQQIQRIREACRACAQIIKDNSPNCPDQTAAIRKLREAMMTANAAIVLRGK